MGKEMESAMVTTMRQVQKRQESMAQEQEKMSSQLNELMGLLKANESGPVLSQAACQIESGCAPASAADPEAQLHPDAIEKRDPMYQPKELSKSHGTGQHESDLAALVAELDDPLPH